MAVETLEDLAEKLKISRRTLSRVMQGDANVAEGTRDSVSKSLEKFRYYRNFHASSLAARKVHVIALVFPVQQNTQDEYIYHTQLGVMDASQSSGYHTMIFARSPYRFDECMSWVKSKMVSGVILVAPSLASFETIRDLQKSKVPLAVLHAHYPGIDSFDGDNVQGGYVVTRHLIGQGRRRIAFLHGHPDWINSRDRFLGYSKAMKEAGLEILPEYVRNAFFDMATAEKAAEQLMNLPTPPDAVVSANDLMAVGALKKIKSLGMSIPEDVAVVGYDNTSLGQMPIVEPSLSSVEQPFQKMSFEATKHLIDKIENPRRHKESKSIFFPPRLVVRGSSLKAGQ